MSFKNKTNNALESELKKEARTCYLLLALPIIGFFVFTLYPMIWAARLSFFSYTGLKSSLKFVGLENFKTIFTQDSIYWKSWLMTFQFAILKLPIEYILGFIAAVFLNRGLRGMNIYRSVYYLPSIVSVSIIGLIFSNIFDYMGPVNAIFKSWHLISEPIDWFSNKWSAVTALVVGSVWSTLGSTIMYFMAALATVPKDLYEYADLEGANGFTVFFKITLPMIAPILQVLLLLSINGLLHVNEYVLVMTNGAPGGSTHTVMSFITSRVVPGYGTVGNIGYSSALSIVTSVIICIIAVCFNKLSDKMKNLY